MALPRKYWVFNLYSAVTVPTQTSAVLVEPMGLEPTTFSLQGNCAPNCATTLYQTTVIIEVPVSDLFVQHNSVLGRRPESCSTELSTLYSTAGCDFFLNPIPSRGFPSLL